MARRSRLARGSRQGILLAACAFALTAPAPASAAVGFLGKWGSSGSGDGEFVGPKALALDSAGDVYVTDTNALMNVSRVQKFTPAGAFVTKFGSAGPPMVTELDAWGVAAASPSEVYVVDSFNKQVERFTAVVPNTYTHATAWGSGAAGPGQLITPRGAAVDAAATSTSPSSATTPSRSSTRAGHRSTRSAAEDRATAS